MATIPDDPPGSSSGPLPASDRDGDAIRFRSITLRTRLTAALLIAQLALVAIGSIRSKSGADPQWHRLWDTTPLQVVLAPIALAAYCAWVYRAYANLTPLGARGLRSSPLGAVFWIFIPCLNLILPFRALAEIARWSGPPPADRDRGGSSSGASIALGWAWAACVNLVLLNGTISDFLTKNIGVPMAGIEELSEQVGSLLLLQFLIALLVVVVRINAGQEARHLGLTPGPSAPPGDVSAGEPGRRVESRVVVM